MLSWSPGGPFKYWRVIKKTRSTYLSHYTCFSTIPILNEGDHWCGQHWDHQLWLFSPRTTSPSSQHQDNITQCSVLQTIALSVSSFSANTKWLGKLNLTIHLAVFHQPTIICMNSDRYIVINSFITSANVPSRELYWNPILVYKFYNHDKCRLNQRILKLTEMISDSIQQTFWPLQE